jgi:L-alanine-DL-glutamate epimerase-like enolase superfamily enzyme
MSAEETFTGLAVDLEEGGALSLVVRTSAGATGSFRISRGSESLRIAVLRAFDAFVEGRSTATIPAIAEAMVPYVGYDADGVETRAAAALEWAALAAVAEATGRTLTEVLGGRSRENVVVQDVEPDGAFDATGLTPPRLLASVATERPRFLVVDAAASSVRALRALDTLAESIGSVVVLRAGGASEIDFAVAVALHLRSAGLVVAGPDFDGSVQ